MISAEKFYNKTKQAAAQSLALEAVNDVVERIKSSDTINVVEPKKLTDKLESIKFSVMFHDDIFNGTKIDQLYEELDIDESNSFVNMYIAIKKHKRKLVSEGSSSWINNVAERSTITYNVDDNVLGTIKLSENQ